MNKIFYCRFLLDSDVFYELCAFGLSDECRLISSPAHEVFVLLMQSRLLVSPQIWWEFTLAIRPVFPVIQVCLRSFYKTIYAFNYVNQIINQISLHFEDQNIFLFLLIFTLSINSMHEGFTSFLYFRFVLTVV